MENEYLKKIRCISSEKASKPKEKVIIVSYAISTSPNFNQTREMLDGLLNKLPKNSNPILHSDQG